MKNLLLLAFSLILILSSSLVAQKNWKHFKVSDGLASDTIHKVFIQDESNIWIATERGLSHFDGSVFTNYTSQNSQLPTNKITDLEWAQNKLWMLTGAGLSSFNGTLFQNYTSQNGLISNDLTDIASTSDGTVWAASLNGVVRYDGNQFIHDSTKVAYAIESDSNDRVYILKSSLLGSVPYITRCEIFDGHAWSTYIPQTNYIYRIKFFKSSSGELFLIGRNQAVYAKVQHPFNLDVMPLFSEFSNNVFNNFVVSPLTFYKTDDKTYLSSFTDDFLLNTCQDSILTPIVVNSLTAKARSISSFEDILIVGTVNDGLFVGDVSSDFVDRTMSFEVNQIRTDVREYGPLFNSMFQNRQNFEFPKDSNTHGAYAADFVVVAKEEGQPYLQCNVVNPSVRNTNPGPISDVAGYNKPFMAKVSRQEINQHKNNFLQSSYTMPQGIADWPANGDSTINMAADLAPFFDANNNGCYDPENGDYPIIKGDEAIYWINHASNFDFHPYSNSNLSFEYHFMLYGYNRPNDPDINQALFLQYRVINRGTVNYDSVKVGFYLDADIGNSGNDYIGCDSLHNIAYAYNGNLIDHSFRGIKGFGANSPALGVKLLSDTMLNFMAYNPYPATHINRLPQYAFQWNFILNSRWVNGPLLKYGGDGYNSQGTTNHHTNYLYTGTPFPQSGWTEAKPGGNQGAIHPGERILLPSIPYFSLNQGESKIIELAIGFGRKEADTSQIGENVPEVIRVLNHAKTIWDTISQATISYGLNFDCTIDPIGIDELTQQQNTLKIFPNPTNGDVFIQSENAIQAMEVYNMNGQLLRSGTMQNQLNFSLDFSGLNNGLYFIRLQDAANKWQMRKVMMVK